MSESGTGQAANIQMFQFVIQLFKLTCSCTTEKEVFYFLLPIHAIPTRDVGFTLFYRK